MKIGFLRLFALLGSLLAAGLLSLAPALAQSTGAQRVDAVVAELVADRQAIRPGESFRLGLRLAHDPHWHTYWRNPGDSGLQTEVDLELPPGYSAAAIEWPAPTRFAIGPLANYGFEGEMVLPIAVQAPAELAPGVQRFVAQARWLVCRDVCIPGEASLALELPVAAADAAPAASRWEALFAQMRAQIPDTTRPIAATWHRRDGGIALAFDGLQPVRAEFFDYEPGRIAPPAPQTLYASDGRARLDLQLQDGAAAPEGPIVGLLVADGRSFELHATPASAPPPELGAAVSVAEAKPADTGAASSFGLSGRPGGLLGALGGSAGTGAGSGTGQFAGGSAAGGIGASGVGSLAIALGFALLGGLILNLMPCVFPVIGLKVMGFMQDAGGHPARARLHSAAFSLGIVLSFLVLAGIMLALRATGEAIGWGFQLQSPAFVTLLALLFVAIGLNFAGVFQVGASLTRFGGEATPSLHGSFGAGVLATVAATPCTAPFMGSAIGFTLERTPLEVLAVFAALGIGMALPYLLLGLSPALLRFLPRPGPWMETFKQALAFPMFATAAWLVWVLALQVGADAVLRLLIACTVLAAALWVYGRWRGLGARGVGLVLALLAFWFAWPAPGGSGSGVAPGVAASGTGSSVVAADGWARYDEAVLAEHRAAGRPVFIDFTAAWCISCQANKKLALETDAVGAAFDRLGVARMRADWTNRDPVITAALARHGRNGVPLYVVYPRSGDAMLLPELLTPGIVLEALERAAR